jgi:hypothetical protein
MNCNCEVNFCPICGAGTPQYREKQTREWEKICQDYGHMYTWMPQNKRACLRCGKFEDIPFISPSSE